MVSDLSCAAVTVSALLPCTPLSVAVIELVPATTPATIPDEVIVAMLTALDAQAAVEDTSF
jgi:hypothetical protein